MNPAKKHKEKREEFYAVAMQIAAILAQQGKRNEALMLKEKVDEMKMLEQECDFPKTKGTKVHLN